MWILITSVLMLANVVFIALAIYYRDQYVLHPISDKLSPDRFYL